MVLHHIAGDGWSLRPLLRDLGAFYRAGVEGGAAAVPVLPVQYADYTLWQRAVLGEEGDAASAIGRQLAYWKGALQDLPEQIELPADRGRPAVSSHRGGHVPMAIDAALHRGLLALSRSQGASLFMVLQAGLSALLTRLGAGTDIALGSPIAGRGDAALDELVGFFVNTLVLRTDTSGNPDFDALIGRVRSQNLAAYAHQELPFERLVEVLNPQRSLSRHPLFQVMLAFETEDGGGAGALQLPGLVARPQQVVTQAREVRPVGGADRAARRQGRALRHRGRAGICRRPVRSLEHRDAGAAAGAAARGRGRRRVASDRQPGDPRSRRARHHPAGLERHRA